MIPTHDTYPGELPMVPLPLPQLRFVGPLDAQNALFEAISKAKSGFESVSKDSKGQIGNVFFKYADLHSLVEATRGPLSQNGVAVMQFLNGASEGACLLTTVVAGCGAQIHSSIEFPRPGDVKEFGKQTTYLRRYAYQAALLLDGDSDADQDGANSPPMKRREPPSVNQSQRQPGQAPTRQEASQKGENGKLRYRPYDESDVRPSVATGKMAEPVAPVQQRLPTEPPARHSTRPPPPMDVRQPSRPPTEPVRAPSRQPEAQSGPATQEQRSVIRTMLFDLGWTKVQVGEFCWENYKKSAADLTAEDADNFSAHLEFIKTAPPEGR